MKRILLLTVLLATVFLGTGQAQAWHRVHLRAEARRQTWRADVQPAADHFVLVRLYRNGHRIRDGSKANGCSAWFLGHGIGAEAPCPLPLALNYFGAGSFTLIWAVR